MAPWLPSWMIYVLYGNSVLDLAIFLAPQQLAVADLVEVRGWRLGPKRGRRSSSRLWARS